MGKRQVIGLTEAWWAWIGGNPAIRLETESEARAMMLAQAKEYGITNDHGYRHDVASPVVEVLWNEPLADGKSCHKTVISPVTLVLHNGKLRKVIRPLSPSKLAATSKGWLALEPRLPAWWPQQYHSAINDPETLVVRGKKPLELQLAASWPNHQ